MCVVGLSFFPLDGERNASKMSLYDIEGEVARGLTRDPTEDIAWHAESEGTVELGIAAQHNW